MTYRPRPARGRRRARCRSVGDRVQLADEIHRSAAGRSPSPLASTCACRAPIGAATSSGGWTLRFSTSATTTSTTSSGPGTSRRRSWLVHPSRDPDLNSLTRGVQLVGRLGRMSSGVAQFSGSLANVCRSRTSRWPDCWNGSMTGPRPGARCRGRTTTSPEPTRSIADPPRPRPVQRGDPHDPLGHGVPTRLLVARHPCARQAAGPPRRGHGHRRSGFVPARRAVPPAPRVDLHPRRS